MTNLIVMLTCSDMTVANAYEVFESCKDLPIDCWGFKDNRITLDEMKRLAAAMRSENKKIFFETIEIAEEACLKSAEHAVILGADYMLGGVFYPSVAQLLKKNGIKYYPYIGDIVEEPKVLMNSTPEEVAAQMEGIKKYGCEGVTLMAYENLKKDPTRNMYNFFEEEELSCIVAGNINSKSRVMAILGFDIFGFAVGSSFFKGDFDGPKGFREQIIEILSFMEEQQGSSK